MTTVSFEWNGLHVTADCYIGTTPPSGPDPTSVEDVAFTLQGIPLPEAVTDLLLGECWDEFARLAIEQAGYKGDNEPDSLEVD